VGKGNRQTATNQMVFTDVRLDDFVGMGNWTRSNTEFCLIELGVALRFNATVLDRSSMLQLESIHGNRLKQEAELLD